MARLLHLWVLKNINITSFEKNLYLSEAIYQNRLGYDKYFDMMRQSPKHNINITLWVDEMIKMFISYNYVYIKMKKLAEISKVFLNDHGRLFLMDIIIKNKTHQDKWFKRRDFNKYYPDYAKTTGDRVIRAFKDSKLFEIRKAHSFEFRLKSQYRNNF